MSLNEPPEEQVFAGIIVAGSLKLAKELCRKPITGIKLDTEIETYIRDHGGKPALKDYQPPFSQVPYMHTICLATNMMVVHGLPTIETITKDDIVTVDLVVEYDGWYADAARTFTYGNNKAHKLFVNTCYQIFESAIATSVMPNAKMYGYAKNLQDLTRAFNFHIVDEFCGHGIGRDIHSDPLVYNHPELGWSETFIPGRSYAIEPVIAATKYNLSLDDNSWTFNANTYTTHFENTYFIGNDKVYNLTKDIT